MKQPDFLIGTFQCDNQETLNNIVRESIECGNNAFDTAPSYKTEGMLGHAIKSVCQEQKISRDKLYLSDKIDAWQMRAKNGDIRQFVEGALKKLQTDYIDMMFVHWPVAEYFEQTWESMVKCKESGLIRDIGVCNVRIRHLLEWKAKGIEPANIQIERHPLRTCYDEMHYCSENGIKVFSYSPLGRMLPQIRESEVLKEIAVKYNKNIGQVILRWHIDTKACPVFTSTKAGRIKSNTDIFDFQLTQPEVGLIEALNKNYKIFLESWGCPGF